MYIWVYFYISCFCYFNIRYILVGLGQVIIFSLKQQDVQDSGIQLREKLVSGVLAGVSRNFSEFKEEFGFVVEFKLEVYWVQEGWRLVFYGVVVFKMLSNGVIDSNFSQ